MNSSDRKIGLIAGRGRFPINFAQAARGNGHHVTALAIRGFASDNLADHVDEIHWLGVGQVDTLIRICHENNIASLAMAGKIDHRQIFDPGPLEPRALRILQRMRDGTAMTIARAIMEELDGENIRVLDSSLFCGPLLAPQGMLTAKRTIRPNEQRDIDFGWRLANRIAELDIGQCVIIKNCVIVAIEALEGTDQAILRAGQLAGPGAVVVKVSRPRQDFRFDLPVIGPQTIRIMAEAGATALAVTAGETVFLDQAEALRLAEDSGIAVVSRPRANQVEVNKEA
jgi:DUF1009 family protein